MFEDYLERITSNSVGYYNPIEMYNKNIKDNAKYLDLNTRLTSGVTDKSRISLDWLPLASEEYKISANVKDYVVTPIAAIVSDMPNRNNQGFIQEDLTNFDTMTGRPRWQTFIGKCCFVEHDNTDVTKSLGTIIDASVQKLGNLKKIVILAAWDRTKNSSLVNDILNKKITTYSMGADAKNFECSICGHNLSKSKCKHAYNGSRIQEGNRLFWYIGRKPVFFEISAVKTPAYISAENEKIYTL